MRGVSWSGQTENISSGRKPGMQKGFRTTHQQLLPQASSLAPALPCR